MQGKEFTTALDAPSSPDKDLANLLSELPAAGVDDCAMRVLDVYERTMQVYQPSEQSHQSAVRSGRVGNGFSASTNF